jgi:hypothetical protein
MLETERGSTWDRHSQTAILNKAAALEAGFIQDNLPRLMTRQKKLAEPYQLDSEGPSSIVVLPPSVRQRC